MQLFTQPTQNNISNYIPDETISFDDRNPLWIDEKFQYPQANLKTSIQESKQTYYSRLSNKLLDSKTSTKLYWSILKIFLINRKVPCIPLLKLMNHDTSSVGVTPHFQSVEKNYWENIIIYWLRKVNIDTINWENLLEVFQ